MGIVMKMGIPLADRDDLVQDIYAKGFQHLSRFRFESRLSTWMAQIAMNTCRDYLTKRKLVTVSWDVLMETPPAAVPTPLEKDQASILDKGMATLPPLYRTLLSLYHHEEMSYEQIGQIMNLPIGTVKSYLFRGRKLLREKLSDYKSDLYE